MNTQHTDVCFFLKADTTSNTFPYLAKIKMQFVQYPNVELSQCLILCPISATGLGSDDGPQSIT